MTKQKQFGLAISLVAGSLMIFGFSNAAHTSVSAAGADAYFGDAGSIFTSKCVECHGRDGRGRTARGRKTHARDMTDGQWQNDVTDERLFNSISNGRNKMPSFKKQLSEAQIDALVAYVRRLKR
jgi:mono/diheme cytochrome c family protein